MLPPFGRMAAVYRAALEHQKGPYAVFWYYITQEEHQKKPELAKVLMAEAFATSTFIKYSDKRQLPGSDESVAWWNSFLVRNEQEFGRRYAIADTGILFSPDNQLLMVPPGHFTLNQDDQPHMFEHWGFAYALIDAHIPYRVITDWKLSKESLMGLKTFIIPNAESIDAMVISIKLRYNSLYAKQ